MYIFINLYKKNVVNLTYKFDKKIKYDVNMIYFVKTDTKNKYHLLKQILNSRILYFKIDLLNRLCQVLSTLSVKDSQAKFHDAQ